MSEPVSRISLIVGLNELVAAQERVSLPAPGLEWRARWLELVAALLVVIAASGACYEFGMRLLAAWQWQ